MRNVGVQVGICSGLFWIPRSEVRDNPIVSHSVFAGDQFVCAIHELADEPEGQLTVEEVSVPMAFVHVIAGE